MQYGPQSPFGYPAPQRPSGGGGVAIAAVVFGVLIVLALVIGGAVALARMRARASAMAVAIAPATWSDLDSPVPVSSDDPMRGERTAPVTIVVFADFQCPFCMKLMTTLDDVRVRYGKDVRIIWKNEPLAFHTNARPCAEAARGVFLLGGNDAFWLFHDKAYANQSTLDQSHYETWATLSGVDAKAIHKGATLHTWATKIDDDHVLATTLHVSGTPTTFINGVLVSGAQPISELQKVIDVEMPKARARLASGTPPDRLYVELSKANYASTPSAVGTGSPTPTAEVVHRVPIGTSPARGPADALVTVVEFGDFQCPFCGRVQTTLNQVQTDYPKDVRIVWKNKPLPFHNHALAAAEFAIEARAEKGDATYWKVHDELFATQTHLEDADLLTLARQFNVNEGKVSTAILTNKYKTEIDADDALSTTVGASGTPTFYINGRELVGAQPYSKFKDLIDQEVVAAKAALSAGTPRSALYDTLTARGTLPIR